MSDDHPSKVQEPDFSYSGYTYTDYLQFNLDEMVEVIRGKLFRMSPAPGSIHQEVSGNLYFQIRSALNERSCKIFHAPYDVILSVSGKDFTKSKTVVQPDLCVICDYDKIKGAGCFGAPDWVIEILSPHTSKKDIQLKYDVYEEAGVKEYWVVMPKQQILEVFILEGGKYSRRGAYAYEDTVSPTLFPDMVIDLSEVFGEQAEW